MREEGKREKGVRKKERGERVRNKERERERERGREREGEIETNNWAGKISTRDQTLGGCSWARGWVCSCC